MAVYIVSGKLGSGKSLCTVGKIQEYLNQQRMVATNLDLYLENLVNPFAKKTRVIRLPDKPVVTDLDMLPRPYEGKYNENKTGLIVLDECGTWFNTRNFRDKDRPEVIDKLLHIRKCGWDVMFIIQHPEMIDKQIRDGIGEHIVSCKRMDRLSLPLITPIFRLFGIRIKPPKLHLAVVHYENVLVERWLYHGSDLYNAYDTEQIFGANKCGTHSVLPPFYVYGRYTNETQHSLRKLKRTLFGFIEASSTRAFFLLGLGVGIISLWGYNKFNVEPIAKLQASEQTAPAAAPGQNKQLEKPPENKPHELHNVRISAGIKSTNGFDYIFSRGETVEDEQTFYPAQLGYSVRWISSCKAALVKGKSTTFIECHRFIGEQKGGQA